MGVLGGIYEKVAGGADDLAGSTDEYVGRKTTPGQQEGESAGLVPDGIQRRFQGAYNFGFGGMSPSSNPIGYAIGNLDPIGDNDGEAETLSEGLLSPGEQYNPQGLLEVAGVAAFEDSNFNPESDGGDYIDLPGPDLDTAADEAGDAAKKAGGPLARFVNWILDNPMVAIGGVLLLYLAPLLSSVLDLFSN